MKARIGDFVRCDRAWSEDLDEPCWYVIVDQEGWQNGMILKGQFRPDRKLEQFQRVDCSGEGEELGVVRECVVPLDEVPGDVIAAYAAWRLLGGAL